ncbi:MAG: homogentisate 1,2-dioxygenase [Candidatus Latescibacterota bacterium]|nr:MAG: homogentisate 1,2-dioxygenase [Candidatus Latescibacterota bacterium]
MPFYVKRGDVPDKRHIQFRPSGGDHAYEELVSREGFSDIYSNLYHLHPPTAVKSVAEFEAVTIAPAEKKSHRHHHFRTHRFEPKGDWISGRRPLVFNDDVVLYVASPTDSADSSESGRFYYRNGNADEIIFVHTGSGQMHSMYGELDFGRGDYIVIPRGVTHQMDFDDGETRLFIIESRGPVEIPKTFRNEHGQILEDAPYCERDFRAPGYVEARDEKGEFPIRVKLWNGYQRYVLDHHPFDVVGWDGFYYPWIFNINDYMPRVGKIHLPPPVHLTFVAAGFVVCSFVPRLFDWHENAVPIPYAHSNVDSDEVLYYVDGQFMSRKGIEIGSMTLHPAGLPHGPQPGLLEKSLGATATNELAVMVDTFKPLRVADAVTSVDDPDYPYSWLA